MYYICFRHLFRFCRNKHDYTLAKIFNKIITMTIKFLNQDRTKYVIDLLSTSVQI